MAALLFQITQLPYSFLIVQWRSLYLRQMKTPEGVLVKEQVLKEKERKSSRCLSLIWVFLLRSSPGEQA